MKHTTNTRRGRNRGNGRRHPQSLKSQTFESSGPDGKIRGTAQQVLDRYLVLGRDAASAGDPVAAEGFYQFAEHYYRIINAAEKASGERTLDRAPRRQGGEDESADEGVAEAAAGEIPAEASEPVQV
ncbi:MAG: DUF4167 domain-containing protein [Rhodospirillales bacterium]